MRISTNSFAFCILSASCVSMSNGSTEHELLQGLFCDLSSSSKPYRKTRCLCLEFIDHKNVTTFNYKSGQKFWEKTYMYNAQDYRLTINMRGDGGLDYVELIIKSGDTIVSHHAKSRGRVMSFERQERLPELCW